MFIDESVIESLEAAGAPIEVIEEARGNVKKQDDHFPVWEENWDAVVLFCGLSTQWRVLAGMGGAAPIGVDYQSLEAAMRMTRVKDRREMFHHIQLMEYAALEVMNA